MYSVLAIVNIIATILASLSISSLSLISSYLHRVYRYIGDGYNRTQGREKSWRIQEVIRIRTMSKKGQGRQKKMRRGERKKKKNREEEKVIETIGQIDLATMRKKMRENKSFSYGRKREKNS